MKVIDRLIERIHRQIRLLYANLVANESWATRYFRQIIEPPLRMVYEVTGSRVGALVWAALHRAATVTKHVNAGIVKPDDAYVIAVNSKCVPLAFLADEPPWIARALYGLGTHAVTINVKTDEVSDPVLPTKRSILNHNQTLIPADLFGSGAAPEVSGVLYSAVDAWNRKADLASSILFVHNRTAAVPLRVQWLPRSTSYSVAVAGPLGTITRTDPQSLPISR